MFSEVSTMRGTLQFPPNEEPKSPKKSTKKKKLHNTLADDHIVYKADDEERRKKDKKSFYFKMKFFSKISKFLQNLKSVSLLNEPNFRKSEIRYMEMEEEANDDQLALIKYENAIPQAIKIICFLILLSCLWKASFEIVLGKLGSLYFIEILGIFACLFMVFFNTNSEMKNQKMTLIREKSKIRSYYKENNLLQDLISVLGLLIITTPLDQMYEPIFYISRVLVLVLINQVPDILSKILEKLTVRRQLRSTISIIKLVFKILISLHIMSLFLSLFAHVEKSSGIKVTWIEHNGFAGSENYKIYVYAWYWSCTIVSTVGFGDITPARGNIYQSLLVSILEILCTILLSYFVNFIGELLKVMGQHKTAYNRDIRSLNEYLAKLKVSDQLVNEARSYLFNKYEMLEIFDQEEEQRVGGQLSNRLKQKLLRMNNQTILKNSILKKYFEDQLLYELAPILQKEVYHPDQWVFQKGNHQKNLWILEEGLIDEIVQKNLKTKPIFQAGKKQKFIGRINFISGEPYQSWGLSQIFTVAYKISRDTFMQILKKFPQQYLSFCQIKHYLIEKEQKYEQQCMSCGKLSHNVINCPKLHFLPKKINSINERKKCRVQIRGQNKRKYRKRKQKKAVWFTNLNILNKTKKSPNQRSSFYGWANQKQQQKQRQKENQVFYPDIFGQLCFLEGKSQSSLSQSSKRSNSSKSSKKSLENKSSKSKKSKKSQKLYFNRNIETNKKEEIQRGARQSTSQKSSVIESTPIIFDLFLEDLIQFYKPNYSAEKMVKNIQQIKNK